MASRSLNKVMLIGNLTRDPELRYTPTGAAVCTLGIATNRAWTTESGEKKEEVEYHRVIAWNKLAELCSQLLAKGRKIYVEGRLKTNSWTGQDGSQRTTTEIIIEDMMILDPRRVEGAGDESGSVHAETAKSTVAFTPAAVTVAKPAPAKPVAKAKEEKVEDVREDINPDDIPF